MHPVVIAPSILSADFAHLADEAAAVAAISLQKSRRCIRSSP